MTRLDPDTGRFATFAFLPQFAWREAIVNAVTHRSCSQQGDHIRVKLFDDRLEVESPGGLPGLVRIDNIRGTRFSRNPRIARALADLAFVRELNEGVNRMYEEMALAGLSEPVFSQSEAGVRLVLYASDPQRRVAVEAMVDATTEGLRPAYEHLVTRGSITTAAAAEAGRVTVPTARRHLRTLEGHGWVTFVRRSRTDPSGFWAYGKGRPDPL